MINAAIIRSRVLSSEFICVPCASCVFTRVSHLQLQALHCVTCVCRAVCDGGVLPEFFRDHYYDLPVITCWEKEGVNSLAEDMETIKRLDLKMTHFGPAVFIIDSAATTDHVGDAELLPPLRMAKLWALTRFPLRFRKPCLGEVYRK